MTDYETQHIERLHSISFSLGVVAIIAMFLLFLAAVDVAELVGFSF